MNAAFEIAAGSIPGREHIRRYRNNQDAYAWAEQDDCTIAVVCDGCSASPNSEVGAKLGAQLLVNSISRHLETMHPGQYPDFWEQVRQDVLVQLRQCVQAIGGEVTTVIREFFLFTVLGAVITPEDTWIFGIGDGVYALNGTVRAIAPFAHNAPPYLAYGLIEPAVSDWFTPRDLTIQVHEYVPTFQVKSLLIGTDGMMDLMDRHGSMPSVAAHPVPQLQQFWLDDRYFKNPDYLRRQLSLMNREKITPDWEARQLHRQVGLLADDTTVLMVRRKAIAG